MKKFEKVLIASDFDGTLKDDEGNITKEVRNAIAYFIAEGGYFTVSTGRTFQGFHLYDPAYINAPVLLANGALAYDYERKSIAFFDGIGEEGFETVRAVRDKFPTASIEMYPFNETFAIHLTDNTERHFSDQFIEFSVVNDPLETRGPWQKVMIGSDNNTAQAIQKLLKSLTDDPSFLPTTGSFIEVMKKGVDKGTGLHKLADYLDVPHDRCYAVGDGYNDVEMLVAAAGAFVPENSAPEALEVATHVVRSNNDHAVAHVIELLDKMFAN